MKKIFILSALAIAAIGCTKSEVVEAPDMGTAISFSSYVGRAPITKATVADVSTVAENKFNVVAYKHAGDMPTVTELSATPYMNNVEVTGTASKSDETTTYTWSYSPLQYWPSDGAKLAFFAYAKNTGNAFAANDQSNTVFTYTVPTAVADQKDLLVAQSVAAKTYNDGPVPVNFYHLLSRIGFTLEIVGNKPVTINSLTLNGPFYTSGTVDLAATVEKTTTEGDNTTTTTSFASPSITGSTTISSQYELLENDATFTLESESSPIYDNNTTENRTPTLTKENRYMMLIPSSAQSTEDNFKISVAYTVDEENLTAEATLNDKWAFEAGKAYEFVLKISSAAIEFTVTVEAWNESTNEVANGDTFTLNGTVVTNQGN